MQRLTKMSMVALASLTLLASACGDKDLDREDQQLIAKAGGSVGTSPLGGLAGRLSALSPDAALGRKLQPYIACINSGADRVFDSQRRYLSWVDKTKGPTCKERHKYAPYKLYSVLSCTKYMTRANVTAPRLPTLEKAANDFSRAMLQLKPLLDEAYTYYQTRGYKADGCAKGKALHPKLMAGWELATAANATLRSRLAFHNGALQARRLAGIEKTYGKNHPRYFHRKVIAVAKDVFAAVKVVARARKGASLTDVTTKLADYKAIVTKMDAAPTTGATLFSSYKSAAKSLLDAFDEFVQRKTSGKRFNRTERRWIAGSSGWMVKGSASRVLRRYNELVNAFNRVRFR